MNVSRPYRPTLYAVLSYIFNYNSLSICPKTEVFIFRYIAFKLLPAGLEPLFCQIYLYEE